MTITRTALWLCAMAATFAGGAQRPNIVLIMADDLGVECIGAHGGESYRTPNLDRLAAEGVRFENFHVTPLCTPTRVELMTGLHNVRNYVQFGRLPEGARTFGHIFRDAGYATGIFGKWQLGREPDLPHRAGFEEAVLWQHTRRPPRYANPGLEINGIETNFTGGAYGPAVIRDQAIDFIRRHRNRPFFLYYPMILVHSPFQPTPDSPDWDPRAHGEGTSHPRYFADMVAYMDGIVGRLDAELSSLGLRERTLLLFLGDNGTSPQIRSRFRGGEYRGGKGQTTVRGTHVPFIASWPGTAKPGHVVRDLGGAVDILPTMCEAAGIEPPAGLDGVSLLPQIRGETGRPRKWLYAWYSPRQKDGDLSVREFAFDARWKLYRDGTLYNMERDPDETAPLDPAAADAEAIEARRRLKAALDRFAGVRPPALDSAAPTRGQRVSRNR